MVAHAFPVHHVYSVWTSPSQYCINLCSVYCGWPLVTVVFMLIIVLDHHVIIGKIVLVERMKEHAAYTMTPTLDYI